ncbi:MAG: endopeptidase La [Muribaculaceae bacterium]|nr:endopeptidase La [Muribaculaceae bacterium]
MSNSSNIENTKIVPIGQIDIDPTKFTTEPNINDLPLIATRNLVLFPGVTIPISLGRTNSFVTCDIAVKNDIPIGVVCQLNPEEENPTIYDGLYKYGVVADVLKIFNLPDGTHTAIIKARDKFKITGKGDGVTIPQAQLSAKVKIINDIAPRESDKEFIALSTAIKNTTLKILKKTAEEPAELVFSIANYPEPVGLINLVATHTPFDIGFKESLLAKYRIKERAFALLSELTKNEQMVDISHEIQERAKQNINENQRNMFLQQQMEAIRQELYGDEDDSEVLSKKANNIEFPEHVDPIFNRELDKLRRLNPQSPEYSVQYSYLETLLDLPWNKETALNTDFGKAKEILNKDHYGLEKVKERILEQLAVLMNTPNGKAPILCLCGAPGVGKTSLGQSIAKALGRNYQRVSLGGLHDEAEIRGHRRTYIGAMPGRIIDAIKRSGSSNPVLLLDEIDKIGRNDFHGDPSAALLEVLDPEQNCHFHDNYIDIDFDLSKVLFIATANTLSTLSQPLLDRMEIIDISGYLLEEKVEIATRHIIPRIFKEHNFTTEDISFSRDSIVKIIECYTSESGVRQLEKKISTIVRKIVLKKMSGEEYPTELKPEHLRDLLGVEIYSKDRYEGNNFAGVVTGLAWTAVGEEILFIESSLAKAKGEKLTLTGNLGDVMKESAVIALQYVKSHATQLGIDSELFDKYSLHIHVPEGAIPKDGPSAGITMATSIISTFTQKKVRNRVAMTGEITLRGKILPVGGIKEKILAAKRAGITDIIISNENRKDIENISEKYISDLNFHYVSTVMEVVKIAITDEIVPDAISL